MNSYKLNILNEQIIYVKDVAKANLFAMKEGDQQTINIGSGKGTTINSLYKK